MDAKEYYIFVSCYIHASGCTGGYRNVLESSASLPVPQPCFYNDNLPASEVIRIRDVRARDYLSRYYPMMRDLILKKFVESSSTSCCHAPCTNSNIPATMAYWNDYLRDWERARRAEIHEREKLQKMHAYMTEYRLLLTSQSSRVGRKITKRQTAPYYSHRVHNHKDHTDSGSRISISKQRSIGYPR